MNVKEEAKQFYKETYCLPLAEYDLNRFGEHVIKKFVAELESKSQTIVWNYGLDSVVFVKVLKDLEKEILNGNGSHEGNNAISAGKSVDRVRLEDKEIRRDNKLSQGQKREVQEECKKEDSRSDDSKE